MSSARSIIKHVAVTRAFGWVSVLLARDFHQLPLFFSLTCNLRVLVFNVFLIL